MLKRCIGSRDQQITPLNLNDTTNILPETSMNLEDKVFVQDGSIIVTPQANLEDTPAVTVEKHTQQETGALKRSKRVRTPSTRLTDFVVETKG